MPLVALLFLVVPLVELYVIVQAAQAFGVLETIVALVAMSVLGAWLVKRQGVAVWQRFNEAVAHGQVPHREIIDGALVMLAGALLLTPGFASDLLGLLLLLPPTRALVRNGIVSRFAAVRVIDAASTRFPFRGRQRPTDTSEVWDATSWESGSWEGDGTGRDGPTGELDR